MPFNFQALEDMLVCPKSKSKLVREGNALVSVDPNCRLQYEIRDDIPVMLIDEAVELTPAQWSAIMQKHGRNPQSGEPADRPDPSSEHSNG
jgi:uncharacterized protein YbaR (Trm112 family)